jgi:hypothetical protein
MAGPSIVGSLNGWDPADPAMDLTLNGDGVWELTLFLTAGFHEYKAVDGDAWGADFPGANQSFTLAADGNVTFLVNLGANVGVKEGDEFVTHQNPVIAGNFLTQVGGTDWAPGDHAGEMTDNGDGTYSFSALLTAGAYECKVTFNDNWDQDTLLGGPNVQFCSNGADTNDFLYDMATNYLTITSCEGVANEDSAWGSLKALYR